MRCCLSPLFSLAAAQGAAQAAAAPCDPRDFGAKADGKTVDTEAINAAIGNCSDVLLSGGNFVSGSVHLRSGLTLTIAADAKLVASPNGDDYDPAEPNKWDEWQDYGHSHFENSFLWGVGIHDVTVNGKGTIDGAGNIMKGSGDGKPNKMFGLKSCQEVRIEGLTLLQGGWFTVLANDIDGLYIDGLTCRGTRDTLDIVGSRTVRVLNCDIAGGGDDAVALKSDYATGKPLVSSDIVVANSRIGSGNCNALQFGSETVGDFRGILWENITVTSAGKAGIGIQSMDGAHISNVTYRNITMSGVTTPVHMFIGARSKRPEKGPIVGSITDIIIDGLIVTAVEKSKHGGPWTPTIDGQPADASHGVTKVQRVGPGIVLRDVRLTSAGGHGEKDAGVVPPHPFDKYQPRGLGTRPAYGYYLRNVEGVTFHNVSMGWEEEDDRPAMVVDGDCDGVALDAVAAMRADGAPAYDVVLRGGCGGVQLTNSPGVVVKAGTPPPGPAPAPPPPGTCAVSVTKQLSKAACTEGDSFGCFAGNASMFVAQGCRGEFVCDGADVRCPAKDLLGAGHVDSWHVCACA